MKMLKKTIKAIVVIAVLKVLMIFLDRYSPASLIFHRQFLFSLQLLVIVWLLFTLILVIFKADKSWVARFLPVLIVMVVLAVDILFSFWMETPGKIPGFLKNEFKKYYIYLERNVMEYEPCSVYDSTYSYKIIPGLAYTFGNVEYKNKYVVNSESLRDEEEAISGPQIICAGNSYTLGEGTDQKLTYPDMLAKQTGKTVLNAGNSGYATVRQLKKAMSADTSFLQYVVLQYSKFDAYENETFLNGNDPLPIQSDSAYRQAVREYRWKKEYFPGKYAITISWEYIKSIANSLRKNKYYLSQDAAKSASYFLQVLTQYKPAEHLKIIVTELNDIKDMNSGFLPAIDSLLQKPQFAHLKKNIITVNVADVLKPSDYYIIDPHLRQSGYEKVASKISTFIASDSVVVQQEPD
jgi:hypothetical protein